MIYLLSTIFILIVLYVVYKEKINEKEMSFDEELSPVIAKLPENKIICEEILKQVNSNVDVEYNPYEEAKELVKAAIAPMGEEYVKVCSGGMDKDWVDVFENENKRSGAYSAGAYGTHPYANQEAHKHQAHIREEYPYLRHRYQQLLFQHKSQHPKASPRNI